MAFWQNQHVFCIYVCMRVWMYIYIYIENGEFHTKLFEKQDNSVFKHCKDAIILLRSPYHNVLWEDWSRVS